MISEKQFWGLIQQSIEQKNSIDKNEQGDCLMEILTDLPVEQIAGFHNRMLQLREELNSPLMRDIAFMMKFGDNNHAFQGFKNWVISLGEEHYQKAKNSPAYLLTLSDENLFVVGQAYFQDLNFVASGAFFDKTDLEFDDWHIALQNDIDSSQNRKLPKKEDKSKDQDLER
ncbi:MAG: DUF4240 domain-containing protein [Flavobacteriales bacterium]|nr:DUF4240 domain-containing protein [Flavobacteriales bacterium]